MQTSNPSSTEKSARMTQIIAVALAASVPLYMAVAWFVAPTLATPSEEPEFIYLMAGILAVVSIVHLVAGQILFASRVRAAARMPTPEQRLAHYRFAFILAFALREAVAVYGLVLSLLSGDVRWCLGFGAVALISMLMGWPRRSTTDGLGSEVPPIG